MRLQFLGAARTVTGSQYLLQLPGANILIDCGLYQGRDQEPYTPHHRFDFDPAKLDAVLLTHAHIDHSGLIPRLCRLGFRGDIFATSATTDLCAVMLLDSAHIQEEDAQWDMRKWRRGQQNTPPPGPLYNAEDVEQTMTQFVPVQYDEEVRVADGVSVRWVDAGHILGAASLEIWVNEDGVQRKLVFSGDIGDRGRPILRDPTLIESADFVVMESTYGNRNHPPIEHTSEQLADAIKRTVREKGQVLVPSFAVGRTQELLYRLDRLIASGDLPELPVFVDSPLASRATRVFEQHHECYDADSLRLLAQGDDPLSFPSLRFTRSVEESKRLNALAEPAVIISASGMCTAGRIRHHLHHRLEKGNHLVLFVGYQARGTLGRILQDGVKNVKLFGRRHRVRARIESVQGLSAHADQPMLLEWVQAIKGPRTVFVTHGEPESAFTFAKLVEAETGSPVCVPSLREHVDLLDEAALAEVHSHTQADIARHQAEERRRSETRHDRA